MPLKRTPLFDTHVALGARMVEFGGWEMPVQYTGILDEHHAVRQRAGLFDICHMGEIEVSGPEGLAFLRRTVTNDPAGLAIGQAQYALLCREDGGVLDDLIVYRVSEERYLLVVNASNSDRDFAWLEQQGRQDARGGFALRNLSDETGLLALQGPKAAAILQPLTDADLSRLGYYHCTPGRVARHDVLILRTGYTGEDGFELMVPSGQVVALWNALLAAGQAGGLVPAGLGARDTLRLEAAMPLYGHELTEDTNPLEAGLDRFVRPDKAFVGRDALVAVKAAGLKKRLVGLELIERGVPRQGYPITLRQGVREVGQVTSGTISPTLGKPIAMAYVRPELARVGTELDVIIRGRPVRAHVVQRPFYRRRS
jgi:aminomethyltransferase